jgi:hypothetical protein
MPGECPANARRTPGRRAIIAGGARAGIGPPWPRGESFPAFDATIALKLQICNDEAGIDRMDSDSNGR